MARWRRHAIAAAAGLFVLPLAAAFPLTTVGLTPASATPLHSWMISRTAVGLIDAYTHNGKLTANAFDNSSTLEIGSRPASWASESTVTYTAYGPATAASSFQYAIAHGRVPHGAAYVMYDDENWSLTPRIEQMSPGEYMAAFVSLAHQHGYKAVLAPAIDLARAMACYKSSDSPWVNYVTDCDLPKLVAGAGADAYEIQSQLYESDTPLGVECGCYEWLVTQAAAQARSGAPLLEILAGLSTNQSGAVSTPQSLYDDTMHTQASTNGYWLNVPSRSTACPQCVPGGAPQVAVGYLKLLGYSS